VDAQRASDAWRVVITIRRTLSEDTPTVLEYTLGPPVDDVGRRGLRLGQIWVDLQVAAETRDPEASP
jgi:hypothetical protein